LMWPATVRESSRDVRTRFALRGHPPSAAVLLLGNYRPTIALVRALKPLGYRVIVGLGGGEGGAQYSRFVDEACDHPSLTSGRGPFGAPLEPLLRSRRDIAVVPPVAEEFVRAVSRARETLPADRTYAVPGRAVIEATLDKVSLWRLAESVGLPGAPYAIATSSEDLARRSAEVGYPVVLPP